MSRTDADGVAVHRSPGPDRGGLPIVIVPGIGMSHRYSEPLRIALARSATVLSLDLSGFAGRPRPRSRPGSGQRPVRRMSVADHARAIAAALAELDVRRCVVVGHSMGAQFAVELARQRPDLVERLVLAAPVVDPRRRTAWQQSVDLLRDLVVETPAAAAMVVSDYLRTGPRWFFSALRAMLDYRTDVAVETVTCPVLVVRGERDPIARRPWCAALARRAAGQLREFAGAGHVLQHTTADALAATITDFASQSTRTGSR